ncbi:hypothetical protein BV20DRAFT_1002926 [Pilatotrama ljubarskyi]|nr:hypothetical protein BV20DRAFT_1002926 [Pilatotrama ljubarskyi]
MGAYMSVEAAFTKGGEIAASKDKLAALSFKNFNEDCHHYIGHTILMVAMPILEESEEHLRANPEDAVKLLDYIDMAAGRARSDDLTRLRSRVITFANAGVHFHDLLIKANRGFKHPITGRLLCPVTKLERFDTDPAAFYRDICKKEIKIIAEDWPLFLYDEELRVPGKIKPGLLRSPLLRRCYQVIWTGPQSALADDEDDADSGSKGQPPLSVKYNLRRVTPATIIYVCSLVRNLLTSRGAFASVRDIDWKGADFERSLVKLFECNPAWKDKTIAWWQQEVYGPASDETDNLPDDCAARLLEMEDAEEDAQAQREDEEEQAGDNEH